MNKMEMCAIDYLYRTRDCKFAKKVVSSNNMELSSVGHAVIKKNKLPKWMKLTRTNCEFEE